MTDDLVKRLRICAAFDPDQAEAADRIEQLEEALKKVGIMIWEDNKEGALYVVRAALTWEKKE